MNQRNIRRKFGQNYLKDKIILNMMQESISPKKNDLILEIGPGRGALTDFLQPAESKITLIEIDEENINFLKKKFQKHKNMTLVKGDILSANLNFLEHESFRVVGNLPYNISTQILLRMIKYSNSIIDMHFLVQKEVAEKICGKINTKNWGKLSIKLQAFFDVKVLFDVMPEAFDIKPKVMSSFISMKPKENLLPLIEIYDELTKTIDLSFSSRRKSIKNNLKDLINWDQIDIDPMKRPENLSLNDYIMITKMINS